MVMHPASTTLTAGQFQDKKLDVPRIPHRYKHVAMDVNIARTQIPLKLSFGMTINKCQGTCVLDLRLPVFQHGSLYLCQGSPTPSGCACCCRLGPQA